jgi:1,4-dihydroxy-2-naphthoate octaprenyltransferase
MPKNRWLSFISPLLLLALWELAVQASWLNRVFYPPPSAVFVTMGELLANGQLAQEVGVSLMRIGLGFLLGGVPAIVVGLLMGISPPFRALFQPIAAAIYPVPKIALLPLIIVVLGLGESSKIVTIAISIFFLIVLNVAASVLQVEARHFEVARSFGAKPWDLFWTVALPASLPGIMTSIKLGMGFALTLIVGVEFVGADSGIGWLIWRSYELYAIDRMIAGLVAVALVGWLISVLLDELERLLVPWQRTGARQSGRSIRRRLTLWWRAVRPWSYTAAVIPVVLGGSIAVYDSNLNLGLLALTLLGASAIQAGTNLVNDYYDYRRGADRPDAPGMNAALLRGELTPRQILTGGLVAFGLGATIGVYLVSVAGMFILWLGLLGILVGFFYTAGPFALAYNALGELAVFIFMGPMIVIGSYYVQAQAVSLPVVLAALPVGCLVAAILHANNLRDLEHDRQVGKYTLATLLGRGRGNIEYYLLIGGTYLSLFITVLLGIAPWLTLISVATLPLALRLVRIVAAAREPGALQPVLQQTAQLHLQFGLLLIVGWVGAALVAGMV